MYRCVDSHSVGVAGIMLGFEFMLVCFWSWLSKNVGIIERYSIPCDNNILRLTRTHLLSHSIHHSVYNKTIGIVDVIRMYVYMITCFSLILSAALPQRISASKPIFDT